MHESCCHKPVSSMEKYLVPFLEAQITFPMLKRDWITCLSEQLLLPSYLIMSRGGGLPLLNSHAFFASGVLKSCGVHHIIIIALQVCWFVGFAGIIGFGGKLAGLYFLGGVAYLEVTTCDLQVPCTAQECK